MSRCIFRQKVENPTGTFPPDQEDEIHLCKVEYPRAQGVLSSRAGAKMIGRPSLTIVTRVTSVRDVLEKF